MAIDSPVDSISVAVRKIDVPRLRQALLVWFGFLLVQTVLLLPVLPIAVHTEFFSLQLISKLVPALTLYLLSYHRSLKSYFHEAIFVATVFMTLPDIFAIAYLWETAAYALGFDNVILQICFTLFIFGLRFKYVAWYIAECLIAFALVLFIYPVYQTESLLRLMSAFMICGVILLGRLRIQVALERATDTNTRLLDISQHDNLTHLLNRIPFTQRFEKLLTNAKNGPIPVAVFMLDVDNFKHFNDSYGHPAGDDLLTEVARIINLVLRRNEDVIGRFGGDEYIAVSANISRELVCEMAERLLAAARAIKLQTKQGASTPEASISIGIYWGTPKAGDTSQSLIKKADEALYLAKNDGRNCYRIYSERN